MNQHESLPYYSPEGRSQVSILSKLRSRMEEKVAAVDHDSSLSEAEKAGYGAALHDLSKLAEELLAEVRQEESKGDPKLEYCITTDGERKTVPDDDLQGTLQRLLEYLKFAPEAEVLQRRKVGEWIPLQRPTMYRES